MSYRVVNLSTGLEFGLIPDSYSRLQSTHLEGKHWQRFIDSVGDDILFRLAIGEDIIIYDCGSRRHDGKPRTIWQGIPFVIYTVSRCWGIPVEPILFKDHNVTNLVGDIYKTLDLRRVKYYRKHLSTDKVRLSGIFKKSLLDGKDQQQPPPRHSQPLPLTACDRKKLHPA